MGKINKIALDLYDSPEPGEIWVMMNIDCNAEKDECKQGHTTRFYTYIDEESSSAPPQYFFSFDNVVFPFQSLQKQAASLPSGVPPTQTYTNWPRADVEYGAYIPVAGEQLPEPTDPQERYIPYYLDYGINYMDVCMDIDSGPAAPDAGVTSPCL